MENASKALMIAGGILLSLMVIGALILMFNQISNYQKSNVGAQKDTQLANFNQDFLKYFDEKSIKGTDIISLVNKVIDYNAKVGSGNYIDYEKKITLKIQLNGFGLNNNSKLFGRTTNLSYEVKYDESNANMKYSPNKLINAIMEFSALEKEYTLITMGKLKSNIFSIKNGDKTVQQVAGKEIEEIEKLGDKDDIAEYLEKYSEYVELKSSTFVPAGQPVYDDGQLKELSFKFSN